MAISKKTILIKIINLIPIRSLRHFLRWYVKTDFYKRYCYEEHIKYMALQNHKKNIETVILGSSHANYGFVPKASECNLGGNSQDLYLAYNMYKYLATNNLPKLKNIILFYDVFSDGSDLSKTRIHFVCIPYKLIYNIPYRRELAFKDRIIERKCQECLDNNQFSVPKSYRGMSLYSTWNKDIEVSKRVESHLKNNRRIVSQTGYLDDIISLTKKNHHNLYIVTPPLRSDYCALLPKYEDIFKKLLKSIRGKKHVKLLNYQNDVDFKDKDFGDCDHLNKQGAIKLANKIRKAIKND